MQREGRTNEEKQNGRIEIAEKREESGEERESDWAGRDWCGFLGGGMCVVQQGVGVSRSRLPASLIEHLSMGPGLQPTDKNRPHCVCSPCSRAHFRRVPTACVSSSGDWAVDTGPNMQHETWTFLRRTASSVSQRSRLKTTIQKNGGSLPLRHSCHLSVLQHVFSAPPGGSCTVVLRKIIRKCFFM